MKKLITIEEHNEKSSNFHDAGRATGVKCNKCNSELYYSDNYLLMTLPPQRNVECVGCGNKTRILE